MTYHFVHVVGLYGIQLYSDIPVETKSLVIFHYSLGVATQPHVMCQHIVVNYLPGCLNTMNCKSYKYIKQYALRSSVPVSQNVSGVKEYGIIPVYVLASCGICSWW